MRKLSDTLGRARGRRVLLALAVAVVALAVASALGLASAGDLVLVSQTSGSATANGTSTNPDASPDGRFVAFLSNAANLGAASQPQAFVRDVVGGTTTMVSVATDGTSPANAPVDSVTVSDNGRRVAFHTRATNVVAGATTAAVDRSYVRDLDTATTTLVAGAPDDGAVDPAISGDGSAVAFASHSHYDGLNSVSIQTYVRDVGTSGTTGLHAVSVGMTDGDKPAISESGRFVAMRGQTASVSGVQVWVRDRTAATTTLVSRASGAAGAPGGSASDSPAISGDGRYVAFRSGAENLSSDDDPAHANTDVYERDTVDNITTLVSRADGAAGAFVANPDNSGSPSVSDDGRLVLFLSTADGLAAVAGNGNNVYLRDLAAGTTELVSRKADGTSPPPGNPSGTSMAGEGGFAAFDTSAALQAGVTGGQVYRRELAAPSAPPTPPVASIADAGTVAEGGPGQVTQALFSVTLDHASPQPVTLAWNTGDGTATGGSDFRAASGQVVFDPGHTSATIAVDVLGDSVYEGDESFQVAIHDAVNAGIARAAGTATIANDDAQPAPPATGAPAPTAPAPGGLSATSGPPVADCPTQITRGQAHLAGCFAGDTAHGKVTLNGLLITPLSAATSITATATRISSSAPVTVTAGDVAVSRGDLDLDPSPRTTLAGALTPANGSSLYGLELGPRLALAWKAGGGVVLSGKISPHFGTVLGTPLDVTLSADETSGLHRDRLSAGAPASLVGKLVTTDLRFNFVPADNRWAGSITVNSPIFSALKIAALIPGAGGAITGGTKISNAIVAKVVKVRSFDVKLLMNPLRIEGTIDAVGGPLDLFGFNGSVRDDLDSGKVTIAGNAKLYGIPLKVPKISLFGTGTGGAGSLGGGLGGSGFGGAAPLAGEVFDMAAGFGTGQLPSGQSLPGVDLPTFPISVVGGLAGGALGNFFLSGSGDGHVKVLGVDVSAHFFMTEKGFGACGQIGPLNAGFSVLWNPFKLQVMGPFVCDVGAWKAAASSAQAGGERTVRLARGRQLLRLVGDTAPPQAVLTGPGGRTITVPAAGQPPLVSNAVAVLRDEAAKTTYVALADGGGGAWKITPQPGSARIVGVDGATILPRPRVTASVRGRGATRTLRWAASAQPGQHLLFEERGAGVAARLGERAGRRGTIRFTPAPGRGRRTITATVLQNGSPRARLTVARFVAPKASRGGRLRALKVTLKGRRVTLRWSPVKGAAHYLVSVRTASGTTVRLASKRTRTLTISDLATVRSATATVTALDAAGRRGPPRKATKRAR